MTDKLKQPALFVGKVDDKVDLSKPPTTGEEYLKRVMIEAQQCEEVVCAKIEESLLTKPTANFHSLPECIRAPEYVKPTMEWQQAQVANFSGIRMYVSQCKDDVLTGRKYRKWPSIRLPSLTDKRGWVNTCVVSPGNERYIVPKVSIILRLSQQKIEKALEYLVEYLQMQPVIDHQLGRWFYALMAALELPLHPDVCSCLRSLARICSILRSQLDAPGEHIADLYNLMICLVGRYFRQLDLADE